MAGEKLLTGIQCRGAKASNELRYLNDGGGLRQGFAELAMPIPRPNVSGR